MRKRLPEPKQAYDYIDLVNIANSVENSYDFYQQGLKAIDLYCKLEKTSWEETAFSLVFFKKDDMWECFVLDPDEERSQAIKSIIEDYTF